MRATTRYGANVATVGEDDADDPVGGPSGEWSTRTRGVMVLTLLAASGVFAFFCAHTGWTRTDAAESLGKGKMMRFRGFVLNPPWRARVDRRPGMRTFSVHTGCVDARTKSVKSGFFDNPIVRARLVRHQRGNGKMFDWDDGLEMTLVPTDPADAADDPRTFSLTTSAVNWEYGFVLKAADGRVLYEVGMNDDHARASDVAPAPLARLALDDDVDNSERGCVTRHGLYFNRVLTTEASSETISYVFGSCETHCSLDGRLPSSSLGEGIRAGPVSSWNETAFAVPLPAGSSELYYAKPFSSIPVQIGTTNKLFWKEYLGFVGQVDCGPEWTWVSSVTQWPARLNTDGTSGYTNFPRLPKLKHVSTNGETVWGITAESTPRCGYNSEVIDRLELNTWTEVSCPSVPSKLDVGKDYVYLTTTSRVAYRAAVDGSDGAAWTSIGEGYTQVSSNGELVLALDTDGYLYKSLESTPGVWTRVESFSRRLAYIDVGPIEALGSPVPGTPNDDTVYRFIVQDLLSS